MFNDGFLQLFTRSVGGNFFVSKDNFPGITAAERVWGTGGLSVAVTTKNDNTASCTDGFCHN